MVIRWGNLLGDKSDGYYFGREEGKLIMLGIFGFEIIVGLYRVFGIISEYLLVM